MISELEIINYESHTWTVLKFSPGLNVFVGDSDKGKSGAFRAFEKLRTNKPLGTGMLPLYWDGPTQVKATFFDGQTVSWDKEDKAPATYQINEEDPINAGTDVPEEVATLFDMESVNVQSQVDRAFLMFDTPGERGRVLNKLAGLDKIDSTLSAANSDVKALKAQKDRHLADIQKAEEELELYKSLPDLQFLIEQAEQLNLHIHGTQSRITTVSKLLLRRGELLGNLNIIMEPLEKACMFFNKLILIEPGHRKAKHQLQMVQTAQTRRSEILPKLATDKDFLSVSFKIKEAEGINDLTTALRTKIERIANLSKMKSNTRLTIDQLERDISDLSKQIPESCPTCGTVLKENK